MILAWLRARGQRERDRLIRQIRNAAPKLAVRARMMGDEESFTMCFLAHQRTFVVNFDLAQGLKDNLMLRRIFAAQGESNANFDTFADHP